MSTISGLPLTTITIVTITIAIVTAATTITILETCLIKRRTPIRCSAYAEASMSDDGCQEASAELSATQVKTLEEKLTDIYEEITNTQKEYDALMSDRAHKRAAKYGDECGNDEDLLVSPDSFFDNLSPSSSENNIDVAGDVGKETLEAALAGDVGKEVGCLEQNAGWLEQHYKEETEEETEEEPLTRRRPRRSATSDSTPPPTKRQRIPRTMPLQIVDADLGTSLSRLRHQLQDESPLYPEGLSSEASSEEDVE